MTMLLRALPYIAIAALLAGAGWWFYATGGAVERGLRVGGGEEQRLRIGGGEEGRIHREDRAKGGQHGLPQRVHLQAAVTYADDLSFGPIGRRPLSHDFTVLPRPIPGNPNLLGWCGRPSTRRVGP